MSDKKRMLKLMFKRKEANLTQEELGEKVGVGGKTIHHYENGDRKPTPDMLRDIANVLNCTIDDIV